MKTQFIILSLFVINSLSFVYGQNKEKALNTGWYYISETNTGIERKARNESDKIYFILPEPIVTKEDIEAIKLSAFTDNEGKIMYTIVMQFVPAKVEAFRLATKNSIGKQLGMIVCNELVNTPKVNMEIPGGMASMSEKDENRVLKYLEDFQTVKALQPDAIIFPPATLMKIAKGVHIVPDSAQKEFRKRWMKMEEIWKSSAILLSSNSADYMTTKEYKDFKNYILTTDSTVLYLFANKYMEAPTGLYAHFLIDIVSAKNPDYRKDMNALYRPLNDSNDSANAGNMPFYLDYLLSFAEPMVQKK